MGKQLYNRVCKTEVEESAQQSGKTVFDLAVILDEEVLESTGVEEYVIADTARKHKIVATDAYKNKLLYPFIGERGAIIEILDVAEEIDPMRPWTYSCWFMSEDLLESEFAFTIKRVVPDEYIILNIGKAEDLRLKVTLFNNVNNEITSISALTTAAVLRQYRWFQLTVTYAGAERPEDLQVYIDAVEIPCDYIDNNLVKKEGLPQFAPNIGRTLNNNPSYSEYRDNERWLEKRLSPKDICRFYEDELQYHQDNVRADVSVRLRTPVDLTQRSFVQVYGLIYTRPLLSRLTDAERYIYVPREGDWLQLQNSNEYVDVYSPFTITWWGAMLHSDGLKWMISQPLRDGETFFSRYDPFSGKFTVYLFDPLTPANFLYMETTILLEIQSFYHFAIVYDGTENRSALKLYINGELIQTDNQKIGLFNIGNPSNGDFQLSRRSLLNEYSYFEFWSRWKFIQDELTQAEIKSLYDAELYGHPTEPYEYEYPIGMLFNVTQVGDEIIDSTGRHEIETRFIETDTGFPYVGILPGYMRVLDSYVDCDPYSKRNTWQTWFRPHVLGGTKCVGVVSDPEGNPILKFWYESGIFNIQLWTEGIQNARTYTAPWELILLDWVQVTVQWVGPTAECRFWINAEEVELTESIIITSTSASGKGDFRIFQIADGDLQSQTENRSNEKFFLRFLSETELRDLYLHERPIFQNSDYILVNTTDTVLINDNDHLIY